MELDHNNIDESTIVRPISPNLQFQVVKEEDPDLDQYFNGLPHIQQTEDCEDDTYSYDSIIPKDESKVEEENEQDLEVLIIMQDCPSQPGSNGLFQSLPKGLKLRKMAPPSDTGGQTLGVFTTAFIPNGVGFGPCVGNVVYTLPKSRFCWKIFKADKVHHFIECADPNKSHWMQFVTATFDKDRHNIEIFQYNDKLYYKTTQDILEDTELLLKGEHFMKFVRTVSSKKMCPTCGKCLSSQSHLARHMRIHSDHKLFKCSVCEKECTCEKSLKKHMVQHTGIQGNICPTCGKSFTKKFSLTLHQRIHDGVKPYECETCGKSFRCRHQLTSHTNTHTREKSYPCNICGQVLARPSSLTAHMFNHNSQRTYKCDECQSSFSRISHLKRHVEIHINKTINQFVCKICGKKLGRACSLKYHMMLHSNDRPFPCKLCKKAFTQKSYLECHYKNIHASAKRNKYKCEECGQGFRYKKILTKHLKIH